MHSLRLCGWLLLFLAWLPLACSATLRPAGEPTLAELRRAAAASENAALAGRWLFAELFAPGGDARHATRARAHLDRIGGGDMIGHLARALDDSLHGKLAQAPAHYLRAAQAAKASSDPRAPLVAWLSVHEALALRHKVPGLYEQWQPFVTQAINDPGNLGWRARAELVDWWAEEQYKQATKDVEQAAAKEFGCLKSLRLAGPFGRGAARDALRSFPAEAPGPWPHSWAPEPGIGEAPRLLVTERHGCTVGADEPVNQGVFYAETYLQLPAARELILAVQGAVAVWVDDQLVLDRDMRKWGIWPSFGVQLWLEQGRHRIVARLTEPRTSIRALQPDGCPLGARASTDSAPVYSLVPPQVTRDPNLLNRFVRDGSVIAPPDDVSRVVAAYLAYVEDENDLATVLLEPLVQNPAKAPGPVLTLAAAFVQGDPVFDENQARDLARELYEQAAERDPQLWEPRLVLALWEGERGGPTAAVRAVQALVDEFPQVPNVLMALHQLYAQLGWTAEQAVAVKQLVARFPETVEALAAAIEVHDARGEVKRADQLVERWRELDPDAEIVLARALAQHDYAAALAELRRLAARRPERKDLAERIYDVMVRAGNTQETWKKLEAAVDQDPRSGKARLALADAQFASGKRSALSRALVDAVQSGASTAELKAALDLVEGMTELEPYRMQARPIIDAYEQAGRHMPGTAARVLDYSAVWVKADGSSRMLEHEIIRIQSPEAISRLAEHRRLPGLVLHMRVIKQDGRVLEPEFVAGKPTVTLPHLEVGDYIETEHITATASDEPQGLQYVGPHWFFREENIAYARSEFVVISPKSKQLIVETRGSVPAPKREDRGAFEVRRWRVDASPAAPAEPGSAPITEFLPSVRVGWGVSLKHQIRRMADSVADLTPIDPRIRRIAKRIVGKLPPRARKERARRLYRWVLVNVEEGEETDGRRVVVGKQGVRSRGFAALCAALGLDAQYAVAKSRLAPPAVGPIDRATQYTLLLMRVRGDDGPVWLTVGNRYAPFGYVPAEGRNVSAYLLSGNTPKRVRTPAGGTQDSVVYRGKVQLSADGSAKLEVLQRFHGRHAVGARQELAQLPENRLADVLQALVGRALSGARLVRHSIEDLDALDSPLSIRMRIEMANFARPVGKTLVIAPPFVWSVGQLATLPERETPLLITAASHQLVELSIQLPPGAKLLSTLAPGKISNQDRYVLIEDTLRGRTLLLRRTVHLPAGRIQPEEYPDFAQFAQRADDAQNGSLRFAVDQP